jgi:hypothetical protein
MCDVIEEGCAILQRRPCEIMEGGCVILQREGARDYGGRVTDITEGGCDIMEVGMFDIIEVGI